MYEKLRPRSAALFSLLLLAAACGETTGTTETGAAGSQQSPDAGMSDGEPAEREDYDASVGAPVSTTSTVEVVDGDGSAADESSDESADDGNHHEGTGELLDLGAADADVVITAELAGGDLTIDERRVKIETGSTVGILFVSDVDEQVHVHGYDLLLTVGPDKPIDVSFLADSPGVFEVELEGSGRFLFEIQVN